MADYKNLTPEQVRTVLASEETDYNKLSFENINDLRLALDTASNNFAANEKNRDSYMILADLMAERIENLSADELDSMSPLELENLQDLIKNYSNSVKGKYEGKAADLLQKIETIRKTGNQQTLESNAQTATNTEANTATSTATEGNSQTKKETTSQNASDAASSSSATDTNGTQQDPIFQENSAVNVYNALEVAERMESLSPSQLYDLRRSLLNARSNDRTNAANLKLEEYVVNKAQQYADNKFVITDMEEAYALRDLLTLVKDYPQGDKAKDGSKSLSDALNKVGAEITGFEEEFGLDAKSLQTPEIVKENIAKLDSMPSNKSLFELDAKPEKLQPAIEYRDVVEILNVAKQNGNVPEISVLTGALQCKELDETQKKQLLSLVERRITATSKLEHKDFKNFEYLLNAAQANGSSHKKQTALLDNARLAYQQQAPLKNKEFQDIYNILNNLQIGGELRAFGRETLNQSGKDSDVALFMEQIRRETEMYLANTQKNITPQVFEQEYAARLRKGLVSVIYADQVAKGKISEKDFDKMFSNLVVSAQQKKPIKLNQDTIIGWQAARTNRAENAVNILGKRAGYEQVSKSFSERIKQLDTKLTQKYGKAYSMVKGVLKSGGWGAAYALAGTTFGPAGIAAVATASFANQAWGFVKTFKKERADAIAKGEKPQNLWQYMKNNKLRTAGVLLSGATAALGGAGLMGIDLDASVNVAKSAAGMLLAGSGALHQASQAYKQTQGSKGKKAWAATKTFAASGVSFALGMLAGKAAGEMVNDFATDMHSTTDTLYHHTANTQTQQVVNINGQEFHVEHASTNGAMLMTGLTSDGQNMEVAFDEHGTVTGLTVDGQQHSPTELKDINQNFDASAAYQQASELKVNFYYTPDKDVDYVNVNDGQELDLNNLSAEQQHDLKMAFLRDPREVNELLGSKEWMSSKDLQEAWDNGTITDEQKAQILDFASKRFDEHGHFQDMDGKPSAAQMEAEAKEWTAAHSRSNETNSGAAETQNPSVVRQDFEPIAPIDAAQKLQVEAVTLQQQDIKTPEVEHKSMFDVKKIKIDENGEAKIVAHGSNGERIVARTDADNIDSRLTDENTSKIKYHNDDTISVVKRDESGNEVKYNINENGEINSYRVNGYVKDIDNSQQTPEDLKYNQDVYQNLSDIKDSAAHEVVEHQLSEKQTAENTQNTVAGEVSGKEQDTAPSETVQAQEEQSQTNGKTPAENVQTSTSNEATNNGQDTAAKESSQTQTEPATQIVDAHNITKSGITYDVATTQEGGLRINYDTRDADLSTLTQANKDLTVKTDNQGHYQYGLATANSAQEAQDTHDLLLKDAYINNEILKDLNSRGDDLNSAEQSLKYICESKSHKYEQSGLTFSSDGKPIYNDNILGNDVKTVGTNDYAKAETKTTSDVLSGQDKISDKISTLRGTSNHTPSHRGNTDVAQNATDIAIKATREQTRS